MVVGLVAAQPESCHPKDLPSPSSKQRRTVANCPGRCRAESAVRARISRDQGDITDSSGHRQIKEQTLSSLDLGRGRTPDTPIPSFVSWQGDIISNSFSGSEG